MESVGTPGGVARRGYKTPPHLLPVSPGLCSSHSAMSSPSQSPAALASTRGSLLELLESQNRVNCAEAVRRASMPDYGSFFQVPGQTTTPRANLTPKAIVRSPRQPQTPPGVGPVRLAQCRRSSHQTLSHTPLFAASDRSSSLNSVLPTARSVSQNGRRRGHSLQSNPQHAEDEVSNGDDTLIAVSGVCSPLDNAGAARMNSIPLKRFEVGSFNGAHNVRSSGSTNNVSNEPSSAQSQSTYLSDVSSGWNEDISGDEGALLVEGLCAALDADIACAMNKKGDVPRRATRRHGSGMREALKCKAQVAYLHAETNNVARSLSSEGGYSSHGTNRSVADDDGDSTDEGMNTCVVSAGHLATQLGDFSFPEATNGQPDFLSGSAISLTYSESGDIPRCPLLLSAVSILLDFEDYKRTQMVEGFYCQLDSLWRRHEDDVHLIITSQSLIRSIENKHESESRADPTPLLSLPSNGSNLNLRSSLRSANRTANTTKRLCGDSSVVLARSGRSTKNNSFCVLDGTTATVDLSSTQATVVVRDAADECAEDSHEVLPSWADCLDKDACLTRPSKNHKGVQLIQSCHSYNAPIGPLHSWADRADQREMLEAFAEREKARIERETRQQLMTYVSPDDPHTLLTITRDADGEPVTLGKGSYGSVYHATLAGGEEKAIKIVPLDLLENGEADLREVVLNEIVILSNSWHPHIVSYYGTYFHQPANELWCVMECCKGKSLYDMLFPPGQPQRVLMDFEIVKVCVDVLSALSYLCSKGYIHRDVKPENVLADGQGSFKLSDFGLSRLCHIDEEHKSSSIEGTLQYLAPEGFQDLRGLITGVPQCATSHRGDIYSYGMCVLVMAGVDTTRTIVRPETYKVPLHDPHNVGPKKTDLTKCMSSLLFDFVSQCLLDDASQRPTADVLLKYGSLFTKKKKKKIPPFSGMTSLCPMCPVGWQLPAIRLERARGILNLSMFPSKRPFHPTFGVASPPTTDHIPMHT